MGTDNTQRTKKNKPLRPLPLPLSPVASRSSVNQQDTNQCTAIKTHARKLTHLQLHLPQQIVFLDPRRRVYHAHVDLSGWPVTDALLQQLLHVPKTNAILNKSSFQTLTIDASARLSSRGLCRLLKAAMANGQSLAILRLAQCQLQPLGRGDVLDSRKVPPSLTELDVSSCEWIDDHFLRTLARHCSALTRLTIAQCRRVTDYGVAAFSEASLTWLDVSLCTKLTDTAILAVLVGSSSALPTAVGGTPSSASSTCGRLRELKVAGLPLLDGLTLVGLRGPCAAQLETFDVSGCTMLRVSALEQLARVRAFTRLTKLDVSRCLLINDHILAAFGVACPLLVVLRLAFCSKVTDIGILQLVGATMEPSQVSSEQETDSEDRQDLSPGDGPSLRERGCRRLQTLDISGCFQITSRGISALGAQCQQLNSLTLDGVRRLDSFGVRALLHGCRNLRTLRWSSILVRGSQEATKPSRTCAAFFSIPHLSSATIAALTSKAANSLKTLHIGATQCDVETLASALTGSARTSSLTDLDVTSLATDALCQALGSSCINLRRLCLSRSRYFSSMSFLAVLQGCTRLRILELESCEQLCDATLMALSSAPCSLHLETLVLANDWQLTDVGITSLLHTALKLRRLDVRHCPEISLQALQALAAARGHISEASRDGLTPRHANIVAFLRREQQQRDAARKLTHWLRRMIKNRTGAKFTFERALVYFREQKNAARTVQRWYRYRMNIRRQHRQLVEAQRLRTERCHQNWTWVQALCVLARQLRTFVRSFRAARERAAFEMAEQLHLLRNEAAAQIQRVARSWLERRRAAEVRHAQELCIKRREKAAIDVQRIYRGYQARKRIVKLRCECERVMLTLMKQCDVHCLAGLHITRIARGFLGRQEARRCALLAQELLKVKIVRAKQIQRAYRAHLARVALGRMLYRGATAIQRVYRGMRGRLEARVIVLARAYGHSPRILLLMKNAIYTREFAIAWKHKRDAGRTIAFANQRMYRGFCGRREARLIRARRQQRSYLEDASARVLQHFFRHIMILVRLARFQTLLHLHRRSAIKIQASWRMWLSKVFTTAQRLKKERHRQHTTTLEAIAAQPQDHRLLQQRGAAYAIIAFYRASLTSRGWQTPTYLRLLNYSAMQIQALVRGHFGRMYAQWRRKELTSAATMVQRVWRGKLGKKMWRTCMEERQQLRRVQQEGDRAALIAKKQTAHHTMQACKHETRHVVVLQRWYQTLKRRQIFCETRKLRAQETRTRAEAKLMHVVRNSTESVVFQARVWRDCIDRKAELMALGEHECVAMEKEIEELKDACVEARAESMHASRELLEWSKVKNAFERSCKRPKRTTEALKQRIRPFALRSKQLVLENGRKMKANRQLEMELQRIRSEMQEFHVNLQRRLMTDPLLLSTDVEALVTVLTDTDASDNGEEPPLPKTH